MFRISQYMQEIAAPTPLGPKRNPPGPVVIWNLIRRCNLTCKHCYSISADTNFPGELSTEQVYTVMDDLKGFKVPVLILSGGEPLLRPDIFDIAKRAKAMGFYVGLSSNGTLIDENNIDKIAECDFNYVGVSLDGIRETHDKFRRMEGAFEASLKGIRLCRDLGLKIGVRFTMTQDNAHDLPGLLKLVEDEGIDRFYFSHLNYAGRGNKNRKDDAQYQLTRQAMDLLFDTCWEYQQRGLEKEFTTGNNDADGVYFLHWVRRRFPDTAAHVEAKLRQWGGNSSGVNVANIDNLGNVHPDTMWWHYTLGNVKERPFSEIWPDTSDPLMAGLKQHPRAVKGRCGACAYLRHLQRQHPRARAADDRRCLGGRPGLLSVRRGNRRMNWKILIPAGFAVYFLFGMAQLAEAADVAANYQQHCAACHGAERLGGIGPALLPENLARLRKPEAEKVIREGRLATQMLGFGDKLSADEIKALVEYAYTPIKPMPVWGEAEIKASRIVNHAPGSLPDKPQFKADPLNLFVVVEIRRPPCHHPRRRQAGTDPPLPVALRAARRAEIHAGRALRLLRLARRLDHQVRPVEPESRRRSARRHQHAQRGGVGRRQVGGGGQLPAAQPGHARCRPEPEENPAGDRQGRQGDFARFGGLRRQPAPELRRRAEGREGGLGSLLQPEGRRHFGRHDPRLQVSRRQVHSRFPQPAAHAARRLPRRLLLHPGLRRGDGRLAQRRQEQPSAARWSISTRARRSPTSNCPACRTSVPASAGSGRAKP